jgi:anti-sigma B factor antagonist
MIRGTPHQRDPLPATPGFKNRLGTSQEANLGRLQPQGFTLMPIFSATHEIDPDGHDVLVVVGELDLATAPQLTATAKTLLEETTPAKLLLDLDHVIFMDSLGVSALIEIRRRASRTDTKVVLVARSTAVDRVLKVAGIQGLFGPTALP